MSDVGQNYESFMALLADESDVARRRVKQAYRLAKGEHHWQKRKGGGRYFEHPRAAALILIVELGIRNASAICAALLHDVPEDTDYIDVEDIRMLFGGYTALLVDALTRREGEGTAYYARLKKEDDPFVLLVKGCDTLANLRTLGKTNPTFISKQLAKAETYMVPLLAMLTVNTYGGSLEAAAKKVYRLVLDQITEVRKALPADPCRL